MSDWSADVCASDLPAFGGRAFDHRLPVAPGAGEHVVHAVDRGCAGLRADHDRDLDRGVCVVGWSGHWRISRIFCGNGFGPGAGPALPWNPPRSTPMPTPLQLLLDPISLTVFAIFGALPLLEALFPARILPRVRSWRLDGITASSSAQHTSELPSLTRT